MQIAVVTNVSFNIQVEYVWVSLLYIRVTKLCVWFKFPEDQPEFPIVTRKYFVQFMFLEGRSANAEIFQILHDDEFSSGTPTQRTGASQVWIYFCSFQTQDDLSS